MTDWKQQHANDSEQAVDHPLVQSVIDEQLRNLGRPTDPLARFGLSRVAMYAAQVARAQALGFDPDLLLLTPDEANSALLEVAARAVVDGVPVHVINQDNERPTGETSTTDAGGQS